MVHMWVGWFAIWLIAVLSSSPTCHPPPASPPLPSPLPGSYNKLYLTMMASVAMMAARVARIPSYPSPRLYSSSTSFSSRFHANRFPTSRLQFSRFQSSALETKRQGTHSSQHVQRIFVKFLESQRQLPGKIGVPPQSSTILLLSS